ncbi:hypothetical protein CLOACE_10380 [Clostridium acetireducens DSM 10703]|uniref:Uncharacterized protein n=1 Tax=Clostridium acetireducens DSM 10703 TaxID=1121290 RepID=A0A1E8EZJ8_9CLOT|nr:hypothetical protein CLOACE_10380 [Clostridium acetireducens DSM 10703]
MLFSLILSSIFIIMLEYYSLIRNKKKLENKTLYISIFCLIFSIVFAAIIEFNIINLPSVSCLLNNTAKLLLPTCFIS